MTDFTESNPWMNITNSRWPSQVIDISQHINGSNSVSFSEIALKCEVVVVESHFKIMR